MKKLLLFCLIAFRVCAQEPIDSIPQSQWVPATFESSGFGISVLSPGETGRVISYGDFFTPKKGKCVPYTKHSEWAPSDTMTCIHDWVDAEWDDVNWNSHITTLQYCQCVCESTYNEARICRSCLFLQNRTTTKGQHFETYESEFAKLLKSKKE